MSEQDKADIQNAKQLVLAVIDLIDANLFNELSIDDQGKASKWCAGAVKLLDDVEERNP